MPSDTNGNYGFKRIEQASARLHNKRNHFFFRRSNKQSAGVRHTRTHTYSLCLALCSYSQPINLYT